MIRRATGKDIPALVRLWSEYMEFHRQRDRTERSLDRFAVELTLFCMRSRVRAAYPRGLGKTPNDDGRHEYPPRP